MSTVTAPQTVIAIRIWGGAAPLPQIRSPRDWRGPAHRSPSARPAPQAPPPQQGIQDERPEIALASALRRQRLSRGGLCALLRPRDLLPAGPCQRTRGARALSHG